MRAPSPAAFTWRGITLAPVPSLPGVYRSARVELSNLRWSDWKAQKLGEGPSQSWYARLRIGPDRFAGRGDTPAAALDAAAGEALIVARYIRRLVPKGVE